MRNSYKCCVIALASIALMTSAPAAQADDPAAPPHAKKAKSQSNTQFVPIVSFESLGLPVNTQEDVPDGVAKTVDGFTFTPGPNNDSGLNDSHYGNAVDFWGYNGTHVMSHHDDVVMTRAGGTFDLLMFDFTGFPMNAEVAFTVTGQPGNIVANFTPDGFCDGLGGRVDFETFVLPANFKNLTSVTWQHFGNGTNQGSFSLDNIVTGGAVPVAEATWGAVKSLFGDD